MAQELSFLLVPFAIAATKGATLAQAARRLGLVAFRRLKALKWAGAAVGIYLLFVMAYVALVGEPEQEDFADDLGPLWIQILLIAIAAPIGEEVCFRGMLFGGLRERLPMWAAALISASLFGLLHVTTGISVVPPLIAFGFLLAMLYEKTGVDRALHPAPHAEQFRRPDGSVGSTPVKRLLLTAAALLAASCFPPRAPPPPRRRRPRSSRRRPATPR